MYVHVLRWMTVLDRTPSAQTRTLSPPPLPSQHLATRKLVDEVLDKVQALRPIAAELDCTLAQLALAWCAKNPRVSTVITGATKESQVGGKGGWERR